MCDCFCGGTQSWGVQTLRSKGAVTMDTTASWDTRKPNLVDILGHFGHQPRPHLGVARYHLRKEYVTRILKCLPLRNWESPQSTSLGSSQRETKQSHGAVVLCCLGPQGSHIYKSKLVLRNRKCLAQ